MTRIRGWRSERGSERYVVIELSAAWDDLHKYKTGELSAIDGLLFGLQSVLDAGEVELYLTPTFAPQRLDANGSISKRARKGQADLPLQSPDTKVTSPGRVEPVLTQLGALCGHVSFRDSKLGDPQQEAVVERLIESLAGFLEERRSRLNSDLSNREMNRIVSATTSMLIAVDSEGIVRRWNAAAAKTLGLSVAHAIGRPLETCGVKWDRKRIKEATQTCLRTKQVVRIDDLELVRDGQTAILGLSLQPIESGEGQKGFLLQGADITARRAAEVALRDQELLYRTVVHEITNVVVQVSGTGQVIFANRAWEQLTGRSPEDSSGEPLSSFLIDQDVHAFEKALSTLTLEKAPRQQLLLRFNGHGRGERIAEACFQLLQADEPSSARITGTLTDVTEERRSQLNRERRLRFEKVLTSLATDFICSDIDSTLSAMPRALAAVNEFLGSTFGILNRVDDRGLFSAVAISSPEGDRTVWKKAAPFKLETYSSLYKQLRRFEAFYVASIDDLDESAFAEQSRMHMLGLQSELAMPLHVDGALIGYLKFGSDREPVRWDDETKGLLQVVATMFANAVERIKREEWLRTVTTRAVKESENKLRAVVMCAPVALLALDRDGVITLSEGLGLRALGFNPGEHVGRRYAEVYKDHPDLVAQIGRALVGESFVGEATLGNATFETHYLAVTDERGEPDGVIGVAINVTDRVKATQALKLRDQAVAASSNGIIIEDATKPDRPIVYANATFYRMTGYGPEEVIGRGCGFLLGHDRDQPALGEIQAAIAEGRECRVTMRCYRKDGVLFWNDLTLYPVRNDHGEITNFVAVLNDVTDQRALEAKLGHAQKMESIGLLAAGVAHEINTPLQYVGDNVRFLNSSFKDLVEIMRECRDFANSESEADAARALQARFVEMGAEYLMSEIPIAIRQTLEGVDRVSAIVLALKEFSHPGTGDFVEVDLNQTIMSTITVSRNEWKYVAELDVDLDPNLPPVSCLPGHLSQVVLNLIVNAAHAIGDRVGKGELDKGRIVVGTRKEEDGVSIFVSDNGGGISPQHAGQVFEHTFTTKSIGKGSGQGLAISKSIVCEQHGGEITFSSAAGEGTTFTIRLPHTRGKSQQEAA